MPTYNFRNTKTGEIIEEFMSISAREDFLQNNPDLESYIESPPLFSYSGTGDLSGKKTDNTWKEVMQTNFAKIDKETGKVRKREDGKVLKPMGWHAPELGQYLKKGN